MNSFDLLALLLLLDDHLDRAVSLSYDLVQILVLLVVSEDLLDGFIPESVFDEERNLLIYIRNFFVETS